VTTYYFNVALSSALY